MRIACDIDGVLADVRYYIYNYLLTNRDWDTYFTHTLSFPEITPMVLLVDSLLDVPSNEVYFVTGRPESNRELTEKWLKDVLPNYCKSAKLLMRPNGDRSRASKIKLDWFRQLQPSLIIDDDPEVVETVTRNGFVVMQVHGYRATNTDMVPE